MELQGIQVEAMEKKLAFYRSALAEKLGANISAETVNLLASLPEKHYEGALLLADYLLSQEQGESMLSDLFQDIATLDEARNRLSLITALLEQIDNEDSPKFQKAKKAARAALADLSLELKKVIRLNR